MEEEKQMAMEDIDSQNGDAISLGINIIWQQSILLLAQTFNVKISPHKAFVLRLYLVVTRY